MGAFACPVCREFTAFEFDRCAARRASLGLHVPSKSMVALVDGAAVAHRDRVPLEGYADHPIERIRFDRVNTAMGQSPLHPFEIPSELGFGHRVVRDTAWQGED